MSRRARPTMRVLTEDLADGWDAGALRPGRVGERFDALSPLSDLAHPIIRKAAECFGDDAGADNPVGPILSSTSMQLWEIKSGQWRGAVWVDAENGAHWLVAAGLAKGEHEDHDDFYQRVKRADASGETANWMPNPDDKLALKRERAAGILLEWELDIQRSVLAAMNGLATQESVRFDIRKPEQPESTFASCVLTLSTSREGGYECDELVLEIDSVSEVKGSSREWTATLRLLSSISPPVTGWDRAGSVYCTIGEPGFVEARASALALALARGELVRSEPNDRAHYAHIKTLTDSTVDGKAVRSLCGVFFVPMQDHEKLQHCSTCDERYQALPVS